MCTINNNIENVSIKLLQELLPIVNHRKSLIDFYSKS